MKLKIEDLVVISFDTVVKLPGSSTDTNDPTPATHCYDCPGETQRDC